MSLNDTIASEALAAAVGGAVSSGILYPLEVLKTRMQADDATTNDANGSSVENGEDEKDTSEEKKLQSQSENKVVCSSSRTPKTPASSSTSVEYAQNLYRSEGMGVFFDGIEISAFQSAIEKACYFFAYTALKRGYVCARTGTQKEQLSTVTSVLLGCLAEWVHLPVTLPIDALTTAIQTSGGSKTTKKTIDSTTDKNTKESKKAQNVLALWMILWKEKSFYKGIQAYWILCFKPALQYTIFEQCKIWILRLKQGKREGLRSSAQLSAGEAFLLGMFSRTIATLTVFPFVRAKVRMQSLVRAPLDSTEGDSSGVSSSIPPTIWKLLVENYSKGGLKALYQGLGPELTRGVLSAALMMMVKERISGGVKKILHRSRSPSTS